MPAISVLMPVRNAAATVRRAVRSIQDQSWTDWELIAVDDGSADATPDELRALQRDDARLRIVTGPARGIAAALNAGLASAAGELVARMDADDEAYPERLAEQLALLRRPENGDVGLVGCLVEFGGDRGSGAGYALHVDWINSLVAPDEVALNRFVESPFAHPSVMFRRDLVARYGGYREGDFPEDYELWLRWLDVGVRMAKVPRVLLRWNDSADRLSRTEGRYSPDAFFRVKAEWLARWLKRERVVEGRDILVWGAGRPTRKRAAYLESHGVRIAGYVDIDAKKLTAALGGTGQPVIAPDRLPPPGECFVLGYVASRGARELIRGQLRAAGFVEGRDFLMAA